MNKEDKRINEIAKITQQLANLHNIENENYIKLTQGNVVEHFQNVLLAIKMYFEELTKDYKDIVEFIGFLNKLAVQYLLENNGEVDD